LASLAVSAAARYSAAFVRKCAASNMIPLRFEAADLRPQLLTESLPFALETPPRIGRHCEQMREFATRAGKHHSDFPGLDLPVAASSIF
jgi:hypothetical protein